MTAPILRLEDLHLAVNGSPILQGLFFHIYPHEIVGLVGESGCGKSLTASAVMGLLPVSSHCTGQIFFEEKELLSSPRLHASLRGNCLGLILQDPSSSLNPLMPVGEQLVEGLRFHKKIGRRAAWHRGIEWLARVGVPDPHLRMHQYPHALSGGMKQRLLIAMALICSPSLLIADEPTTALDVTVQAQILELLLHLQAEEALAILLITHDLGVAARCCQRIMVMHEGKIVESGPSAEILTKPSHPYSQSLLRARRSLEQAVKEQFSDAGEM